MLKGDLLSLTIYSKSNDEKIIFENFYLLRDCKGLIQKKAYELGGTINPSGTFISVPTSEHLHQLVRFIEELVFPENNIVITVQGKLVAKIPKTQKFNMSLSYLLSLLPSNNGTQTKSGFSFIDYSGATNFLKYVITKYLY